MFNKDKLKKLGLAYIFFSICTLLFFSNSKSEEKHWYHSNGNFEAHKYSILNQINDLNSHKLDKVWAFRNGYIPKGKVNNQTTPIFTGSSIIVTSLDGFLISLNPIDGKEIWRKKLIMPVGKRGLYFSKKTNSIFVTTKKGVVAINSDNGEFQKKFGTNGIFGNSLSLVPPILNEENLFVAFTNKVESFNLKDGKSNWNFDLNGARIWSGFSFDNENKTIFIVTSNLINLWGNTKRDPDYSNSIILLNSKTGKVRCKFQDVKHDHWDFDMISNPIVIRNVKFSNNKLVYSFGKTGNVIVIDVEKCKLAYSDQIEEIQTPKFKDNVIVSEKFNQTYSSTQNRFLKPEPLHDQKYNLENYLKTLSNEENIRYVKFKSRNSKYGNDFIPLSIEHDVIIKGLHGGPSWFGGTYDKINNQIIIPSNHYPWILRSFYYDRLYTKLNGYYIDFEKKINKDKKNKKNYLSPWEQEKVKENNFRKIYSTLPRVLSNEGWKIYKNSCQSCHGLIREGKFEGEDTGDEYITNLIGISFTNKFLSMNSKDKFVKAHKYSGAELSEISEKDLKILKKYFSKHDKLLKNLNLLGIWGRWQLFLDKNKLPASKPPWGKISAINLSSGKINWSIPFGFKIVEGKKILGDTNFGGIISTAGNIFIATGTPDKYIRIHNSNNGNILWEHKLPAAGSSTPITFEYKDEQYIVVNASGGRFHGYEKKMGDYIIAFKLR